jgi:hypothetical protein
MFLSFLLVFFMMFMHAVMYFFRPEVSHTLTCVARVTSAVLVAVPEFVPAVPRSLVRVCAFLLRSLAARFRRRAHRSNRSH